jgi:hypothetical protein
MKPDSDASMKTISSLGRRSKNKRKQGTEEKLAQASNEHARLTTRHEDDQLIFEEDEKSATTYSLEKTLQEQTNNIYK